MKNWIWITAALITPQTLLAADEPALLQWSHRVELSSPVSGVVKVVNVDVGNRVKKGQVLLALDNSLYQSRVAASQATISRLAAELAEARRDLERVQELHARTVVATAELDLAKLRNTRAESMLAEAQAGLKQNQKVADDAKLRAPFDAVVIAREVELGMSVAATLQPQTLLVLAKSGEMLARAQLNGAQIEKLKIGQPVTVVSGGQSYPGKVKTLGLEPSKLDGGMTYLLEVIFASKEQLRAGVAAVLKLP